MEKYLDCLKKFDIYYYSVFKKLPKLSIKDILKYEEPYKMALLFFYGYSSMYKKYDFIDLNRYINTWSDINLFFFLIYCKNIKGIKYLVSKGINIHKCNSLGVNNYLLAVYTGHIKIIKYFESIGENIHKKTLLGNNAYLIATIKGRIRLMKYVEKKGINIYLRNINRDNYLNDTWPNYNKIAPYVFKNMNYKLNRFKMCLIANNIFGHA
jgi:ankyrin repeat protein